MRPNLHTPQVTTDELLVDQRSRHELGQDPPDPAAATLDWQHPYAPDPWQDQTPKLLYGRLSWSIDSYRSFLIGTPRHAATTTALYSQPSATPCDVRKRLS
jgi:hypothetical protein